MNQSKNRQQHRLKTCLNPNRLQHFLYPGKAVRRFFSFLLHSGFSKSILQLFFTSEPCSSDTQALPASELQEREIKGDPLSAKPNAMIRVAKRGLSMLAQSFVPLIPLLILSGLLSAFSAFLPYLQNPNPTNGLHQLAASASALSTTIQQLIPLLVGWSSMQGSGGTPWVGMILAGTVYNPLLSQVCWWHQSFLPGRGGIIAVLFICWTSSWLEHHLKRSKHKFLSHPCLVAMASLLVGSATGLLLLQPLASWLSNQLVMKTTAALTGGGALAGACLATVFLPFVLTGLHPALMPVHLSFLEQTHQNPLLPILSMAGMGQLGAGLLMWQRAKEPERRQRLPGLLGTALLGIGEPLMFGATLPAGVPFLMACLGGGVGGALIKMFNVASTIPFGLSGLPLTLAIVSGGRWYYLLSALCSMLSAYLLTAWFYHPTPLSEVNKSPAESRSALPREI